MMNALLIHVSGGYVELDDARAARFLATDRIHNGQWRYATEDETTEYLRKRKERWG